MTHNLDYYGSTLSNAFRTAVFMRGVDVSHWDVIADLNQKKWFGYRFLDPAQSLFLFADRFRHAYANAVGRRVCRHGYLLRHDLVSAAPAVVTAQLFHAMCYCDELGIPYDHFCQTAVETHDRLYAELPNPNQLYRRDVIIAVKQTWDEKLEDISRLQLTGDPHFSLANYHGHPWQIEYMDFVLDQIAHRSNKKYALQKVCFLEPQVLPSRASRMFGIEVVQEARELPRF